MKHIILLIFVVYSLAMICTKSIGVKELYLAVSMILASEYIDCAFKCKEEA